MEHGNNRRTPCPCKSGNAYADCCQPFHKGKRPDTALQLMRSRYSAYALCLPAYIIHTTHPGSPQFCHDTAEWSKKISEFCTNTKFKNLEILYFQETASFATVTFTAHLAQDKKDTSFTEKSYFEKIKGKWLYRSGQLFEGHAPNVITTNQLRLLPIAYYGSPILRKIGDPIANMTADIRKLVEEMVETMDACNGIGLAAPQIHHSIKLFVIRRPVEIEGGKIEWREVKIFVNPELSMPSRETWKVAEGCLSIPSIHAEVERPREVTVEYSDLEGNKIKERVSGWEARVIMHETDHVNGILFIDHLGADERQYLEPFLKSLENTIHDGTEL
ncbi:MAG: peptide deformylase [Chlamydiia bacterium]|nr:peptide deformylase [Chlamydiia bacterium]